MSAPIAETKVQETADDAAVSKLSSVRLGYVPDPFLGAFVRKFSRRSPLINRGYFSRIASLELILRRFVTAARRTGDGTCAVVSLGAGFDTSFFRLAAAGFAPTVYYEVDFPEITARKSAIIRKHAVLLDAVAGRTMKAADIATLEKECAAPAHAHAHGAASASAAVPLPPGVSVTVSPLGGANINSAGYALATADLRDTSSLQAALTASGITWSRPTLLLSECVLVYLEPEESCSIIAWAARAFPRSVFVTYEQIRPHDAFGQVMARNLEERGYSLRGLNAFPDIPAQTARYRELGYGACTVCDMNDVYYRLLPRAEVARVERLELFDEVEEWHLMSAHYCIAIAVNEIADVPQHGHAAKHAAAAPASPMRNIVTDMPAPAPRVPRSGSSHAALSPREVAAAVVQAHEEATPSSQSSTSPSTTPAAAPARLSSRSRSRSGTAPEGELDALASAVSYAAGTTVESVMMDVTPTLGHVGPESSALGRAVSSGSTSSGAALVGTIRTHAGDIVLGGAHVDFEAIAEAEGEMDHARHVREAAGIDVLRDVSTAGGAKHGAAAPPGLRSPTSAPHAAAVEGSKAGIDTHASKTTYDAESLAAADRKISLLDCLFPIEQWKVPAARGASASKH